MAVIQLADWVLDAMTSWQPWHHALLNDFRGTEMLQLCMGAIPADSKTRVLQTSRIYTGNIDVVLSAHLAGMLQPGTPAVAALPRMWWASDLLWALLQGAWVQHGPAGGACSDVG